jgi:hypothetical protein
MNRGIVFIDDDPDEEDLTQVNRRWTMEVKSQAVSTEIASTEFYVSHHGFILDVLANNVFFSTFQIKGEKTYLIVYYEVCEGKPAVPLPPKKCLPFLGKAYIRLLAPIYNHHLVAVEST